LDKQGATGITMDNLNLDQHISRSFNQDLEAIRTAMLEMGGVVEKQVSDAVKSVIDADSEIAEKVISTEDSVDLKEKEIDDECTKILAMRQPAASDLRLVLAVSKTILDLERIGDEAAKISKFAVELCEQGESPRGYIEIRHIGNSVHKMLQDALDAFARFDVDLAMKVVKQDKEVDQDYATAIRELMTYMMEDPRSVTRIMQIIWTLRALERIGDHGRNIAEQVIFLVKGKDVRHISYKAMKKEINE
jgi:phosphate transport system protein